MDLSWISDELSSALGYAISEPEPAYVGNPITKEPAFNGDKKGLFWIHGVQPDPDSPFTATSAMPYAAKFLEYDAPVMVQRRVNGFVIVDFNPDEIWEFFGDGARYEIPQAPITEDQLSFGTIQPDAPTLSMKVILKGATYYMDGIGYRVLDIRTSVFNGHLDTLDVAISVPTTVYLANGVLVQVNPKTGLYSLKQQGFLSTLPLNRAHMLGDLPTTDEGNFCLGYVRLLKGMASITRDHIWNAPELLSKSASFDDIITSEGHIVVTSDGRIVTKGESY